MTTKKWSLWTVAILMLLVMPLRAICGQSNSISGPGVNLPIFPGSHVDKQMLLAIKSAGFVSVRQPVHFRALLMPGTNEFRMSAINELDTRVRIAQSVGLSFIIDIHPVPSVKREIFASETGKKNFAHFIALMAEHVGKLDGQVYLELLNEPPGYAHGIWWPLQRSIIASVRKVAPDLPIIASAAGYATASSLMSHVPYAAHGVIYAFHFYKPYSFTMQGGKAGKKKRWYHRLGNVEWPYKLREPGNVNHLSVRDHTKLATDQRWDSRKIDQLFRRMAAWRDKYGVSVICDEFGVYANGGITAAARNGYLSTVAHALDAVHIPWLVWQFSGGFGIARQAGGKWSFDQSALKALGMRGDGAP